MGSVFFGVTLGIICFMVGVLIIPFFTDDISLARTYLNCTGADSISDGIKFTCLQIDLIIPYLIWFFCSLAVGIIGGATK
jgi:hypothetical protein